MKSCAFVFPGQGSQKVGMGKDLFNAFPESRRVFEEADEVLNLSFTSLCFEGPEEDLRQTQNAQPALLTMSLACLEAARKTVEPVRQVKPAFLAGHSLGEYTALAVAGVIDYRSAIYLARERGRLMHEAAQRAPGAMTAILGMDEAIVNQICAECGVWLANINCPGQLVISGARENIEKAQLAMKARGAARVVPLQVSGAFHSPLMQPAADGLYQVLSDFSLKDPVIPIIANTTGEMLISARAIKDELMYQLSHTVQWQKSVEFMIKEGIDTFIEIGSGNVLTGLIKRIDKTASTRNIGNINELSNLATEP